LTGLPWRGVAAGLVAVFCWAVYLAMSRAGVTGDGLHAADFAVLRFAPAGLLMLPLLLRRGIVDLGGLGWWRGLALTAFAGPAFILLAAGGYEFAPLAHGAVLQPATVTVMGATLAWLVLGERPGLGQAVGVPLMLIGLVLVAGGGGAAIAGAWRGDLMFVGAGLLWAGFALLLRRWKVEAWLATAVVSVLSALLVLPAFTLFVGFERLAALPPTTLALQLLAQGVLSGVVAIWAFSLSVALLGSARASLFPGLVPVSTVLIGIPLAGEWPLPIQIAGLATVTFGLALAVRR